MGQFERDSLGGRMKAGIDQARQKRKLYAHSANVAPHKETIQQLHAHGLSQAQIAQELGIGRTSVRLLWGRREKR